VRVFKDRVLKRIFGPKREEWWEAAEDCIMRSFIPIRFTKFYKGDQVKEDEMGGTWDIRECVQNLGWKT
jgi:hypothetical protein